MMIIKFRILLPIINRTKKRKWYNYHHLYEIIKKCVEDKTNRSVGERAVYSIVNLTFGLFENCTIQVLNNSVNVSKAFILRMSEYITLNTGAKMPRVGLGTWKGNSFDLYDTRLIELVCTDDSVDLFHT